MLSIIVLAAGQGTRMKSDLPKILHPLGGRPVVHYSLDLARDLNPETLVLVVSPDLKALETPFSPEVVVQPTAQGTGDAVKQALPYLKSEGHVLILYGDTPLIRKETLEKMLSLGTENPDLAVILLSMRPENPHGYGRVMVNDLGELEDIIEEKDLAPDQKNLPLCNSGVMMVRADLIKDLLAGLTPHNAAKEYYLPDIVKLARQKGYGCGTLEGEASEFAGINTRQDLAHAESVLQNRWRDQAMSQGVTLKDPQSIYLSFDTTLSADVTLHPCVVLGPGVVVDKGAEIYSFCELAETHVGPCSKVGPFARLRGGVDLQEKAEVGNFVEVKKSIFAKGAKAKHLSYIGDAHVGEKANIGAGTITCNYDGFQKATTRIGEGAFIGSNTALIAPVSIGDGAIVGAGSVITSDVDKGDLAVARAKQTALKKGADKFRAKRQKTKESA